MCLQKYDGLKKVVVVGIDMTAAWKMELQSVRDRQMALQASRLSALGEMAGGIAHEINNPLMIIQGIGFQVSKVMQRMVNSPTAMILSKGRIY